MALRGGERSDQRPRIERQAEIAEESGGAFAEQSLADEHPAEAGLAGEDVLRHGQLLEDLDLLRHIGDAVRARLERRMERDRLSVEADLAVIRAGRMDAVEDLDEGRLAGAVLAEERMDLAAPDAEVDAAQRLDAGEALRRSRSPR